MPLSTLVNHTALPAPFLSIGYGQPGAAACTLDIDQIIGGDVSGRFRFEAFFQFVDYRFLREHCLYLIIMSSIGFDYNLRALLETHGRLI